MDDARETVCGPSPLPEGLTSAVTGYAWARDTVGESGGMVYRLHGRDGAPELYLKHGKGRLAGDVVDEMVRLRWLAAHLQVPQIRHFVATPGEAWLLMTALPGQTAWQVLDAGPEDRVALADTLAAFMRRLHSIPIAACPFNSDHSHRLTLARARIDAGLVDEEDFDAVRKDWTAEQVWEGLQAALPLTRDPVVTHGDFSLDNLLINDGQVVGCIDAGRVGIADRWQDLAILWNCLGEFGPDLQDRLLTSYGIALDRTKLDFHLMLDELF